MYVHHVMGVCSIVFDIDGMLFEFCMNFLNIEKNKILIFNFLNIEKNKILIFNFLNFSCFLRVLCYFQHLKKIKIGNFNMKLNGRWSPQIVDTCRDSGNLYPIYIKQIVVLAAEPVGDRVALFLNTKILAPSYSFISCKKKLSNLNIRQYPMTYQKFIVCSTSSKDEIRKMPLTTKYCDHN